MRTPFGVGVFFVLAAVAMGVVAGVFAAPRSGGESSARDFDFLVGSWEFTSENTAAVLPPAYEGHRQFGGRWLGTRLGDGHIIEDDYRVVDPTEKTRYLGITFSAFDARAKKWNLVFIEPEAGTWHLQTAERDGKDMILKGADSATHRARFSNIGPDGFKWDQEVTNDGGKHWIPGDVHVKARRTGATSDR